MWKFKKITQILWSKTTTCSTVINNQENSNLYNKLLFLCSPWQCTVLILLVTVINASSCFLLVFFDCSLIDLYLRSPFKTYSDYVFFYVVLLCYTDEIIDRANFTYHVLKISNIQTSISYSCLGVNVAGTGKQATTTITVIQSGSKYTDLWVQL